MSERDYRNNTRHQASEAEPWWAEATPADKPRYARALRLSQFARDIARGPTTLMRNGRLAYRRQCLDRWRDYLDGWTPPRPRQRSGRGERAEG